MTKTNGSAIVIKRQQTDIRQFERALLKRDMIITTVQIIALVVSIFGAGGYLAHQNSLLVGQLDKRIEETNKRMDERFDEGKRHIDQVERNLIARFEDLKQEVRADRQRRGKQ